MKTITVHIDQTKEFHALLKDLRKVDHLLFELHGEVDFEKTHRINKMREILDQLQNEIAIELGADKLGKLLQKIDKNYFAEKDHYDEYDLEESIPGRVATYLFDRCGYFHAEADGRIKPTWQDHKFNALKGRIIEALPQKLAAAALIAYEKHQHDT